MSAAATPSDGCAFPPMATLPTAFPESSTKVVVPKLTAAKAAELASNVAPATSAPNFFRLNFIEEKTPITYKKFTSDDIIANCEAD
jgi:hypothetical protein